MVENKIIRQVVRITAALALASAVSACADSPRLTQPIGTKIPTTAAGLQSETPYSTISDPTDPSVTPRPTPSVTPTLESTPSPEPTSTPEQTSYTFNLYDRRGVHWQVMNACVGDSAQILLNFAALAGTGGNWKLNVSLTTEDKMEAYALNHDVTPGNTTDGGSDPVGLRETINHYGFAGQQVFKIRTYSSYGSALEGIVDSIRQTHRPVIAFTDTGYHLLIVSGYKVTDAKIEGVYVTDPLGSDHLNNAFISAGSWSDSKARNSIAFNPVFDQYLQKDGTLKDPLTGRTGKSELYGKWVVVSS
jgi:hypothetical protein